MYGRQYFIILLISVAHARDASKFPDEFLLGFATSSYQIEGAWDEDGKGPNIWDTLTHNHPTYIAYRKNADIAADSYHKYKEDVKMLKKLGAQVYSFSLSWSRILPKGTTAMINQPGIDYYNHLIDELLANGIEPIVTLHYWDLPQALQDIGGWPNPLLADHFADYARIAFKNFGDRVKWWVTIAEPFVICFGGYKSIFTAPENIESPGVADYLCAHTILMAHAKAYNVYEKEFRDQQKGVVGITVNAEHMEPKTEIAEDVSAAHTAFDFMVGWFVHPILSEEGDYPQIMIDQISENSYAEGLLRSRLPSFDNETIDLVRGTADFLGVSHFTTILAEPAQNPIGNDPSWLRDTRLLLTQDPSWPATASVGLKVVPWGLRKVLNQIKKEYDNVPVFVLANGYADKGGLNDTRRIDFHKSYLQELLKAIHEDKCNVLGYTAWTFLDSFYWNVGYTQTLGIIGVDFTDRNRTRYPKASAKFFKDLISKRKIPTEDWNEDQILNEV